MEAEEIEKMQEDTKKKLRENRKSFQRIANSAKKPKVVKYSKPTTESVGFKFRTDRRLRRRAGGSGKPPVYSSGLHPSTFPMTLRSANKEIVQPEVHNLQPAFHGNGPLGFSICDSLLPIIGPG